MNLDKQESDANEQYDRVNISDRFLISIFESVKQLEELEKVARDGVEDIVEHLNIHPNKMANTSFHYFRMIITETGILLRSASPILDKGKFEKWQDQLEGIKDHADTQSDMFITESRDRVNHTADYFLTEVFFMVLDGMCEIRKEIVMELASQGWIFSKSDSGGKPNSPKEISEVLD